MQLLLWTLVPWVGILLLGHQLLVGCKLPTLEGLFLQALVSGLGFATLLRLVWGTIPEVPAYVIDVIALSALVSAEILFVRKRKILYLAVFEMLAAAFFAGGMLIMIAIGSV